MFKVRIHSNYRSQKGNLVFRYEVLTNQNEYISAQKSAGIPVHMSDNNMPFIFSTVPPHKLGKNPQFILTSNGKVVADTSLYDSLNVNGKLDEAIASQFAETILSSNKITSAPAIENSIPEVTDDSGELDNL